MTTSDQTADDGDAVVDGAEDMSEDTAYEPVAQADEEAATPAPTGVRAADDARERLAELSDASLEAHVDIYEDVHRRLHEGLADLDES